MSKPLPYVPVLRWKGAEISAVRDLTNAQRAQIKPLFEFVPKAFSKLLVERAVALKAREVATNWGLDQPCFIDPNLLGSSVAAAVYALLDKEEYLTATLVTGLQPRLHPHLLRDLKSVKKHGLAIRVSVHEFRQAGWRKALVDLLADLQFQPTEIDLVIDYGLLASVPDGFELVMNAVMALGAWRMVVLLAGSFPSDLSKLRKNDEHVLPRLEWKGYVGFVQQGGKAAFGDYTIQHAVFEEHEGRGMNFSASIRYTHYGSWFIMRGESIQAAGAEQWPAHAQLLCEKGEFRGKDFSAGDAYISTMAAQQENNGTAKDWLSAGINHHIVVTVDQLNHLADIPATPIEKHFSADWPARIPTQVSVN